MKRFLCALFDPGGEQSCLKLFWLRRFFFDPRTFQFSEVSAMKVIQEIKSILALLFLCSPPQNNIAVLQCNSFHACCETFKLA